MADADMEAGWYEQAVSDLSYVIQRLPECVAAYQSRAVAYKESGNQSASAADLKDSLGRLRNDVETCKKHGDKYAFRKLITALGGIPAKLADLTKDLEQLEGQWQGLLREDLARLNEQARSLEVPGVLAPEASPLPR